MLPRLATVFGASVSIASRRMRLPTPARRSPTAPTAIKKAPTSYLKKFYFDTITFDARTLRHLIDQWGAEHVLLGTDYPYDMGEEDPVGLIGSVPRLSRAERERMMGGNAARLLGIKR